MRFFLVLTLTVFLVGFNFNNLSAQSIFSRVKQKAQDKMTPKTDKTAVKPVDSSATAPAAKDGTTSATGSLPATSTDNKTIADYKNYDFVPGDKIIFQSQLADERVGEIPSQFILNKGQVDIQTEDDENAIHIPKGPDASISPRFSTAAAIPDAFTIEFDYKNEKYGVNHVNIDFGTRVGTYGSNDIMTGIGFNDNFVHWTSDNVNYPDELITATKTPMQWHHYAIAFNKNAGKAYIDQFRVANINNLAGKHDQINIEIIGYENSYLKNIRIAAGGMDLYKKITTDTKIITHGILFTVDQASLQPASMGTINTIYNLLKANAALKFEIDGHTDNTGTAAHNLTLSQSRADAVKTQLVSMGIDASRLTTKGFGDAKPLGKNDTPEDKANNRRVEFIKI